MNIKIGKFILTADGNQFILKQEKIRKDGENKGKPFLETSGYYHRLESALGAIPQKVAMSSDATDLADLVAELREYRGIVQKALK